MTTKPPSRANELAARIDPVHSCKTKLLDLHREVAAELRRLHAENQQLRADLEAVGAGGVGPLMPPPAVKDSLTDEEITEITDGLLKVGASMHDFARAIERAHGIGAKP